MKKLILLAFIVLIIPIVIIEDTDKDIVYYSNNYPDIKKDKDWEIVKNHLFSKKFNPGMAIQRFNGPILITLNGASSQDSAFVKSAMQSLKTLIPNKTIAYFENYTRERFEDSKDDDNRIFKGYNFKYLKLLTIRIHFKDSLKVNETLLKKKELETNIDREYTYVHDVKNSPNLSGFLKPELNIAFNEDSNMDKRKRIVEFGLIKTLACKSEFLGMLDMEDVYIQKEERLDELRFLIKKLYTPNIVNDFKNYMYKTYPWRYASNYLSEEKTKAIALWISISLAIILCWLSFGLLYKRDFKRKYFNYFLPVLFFMISALYVYKLYEYITIPISFEHWRQYISIHIIFTIIAAFIALSLMLFDKYIIRKSMPFTQKLILKTGFTLLTCLTPIVLIYLAENNQNSTWLQLNPFLLVVLAIALGRALLLYLDHFSENLVKQKDIELSQLREVNAQAQIKLLQSQINPHFLYNALNSIASLAQTDGAKTERMALSLSDLFKYTINRKGKKKSTIKDEVDMVKNYLEVEQIRFGDRLKFSIEVEDDLENIKIPMFLIQPLIENAVKHGVSKIEDGGIISLKIFKRELAVVISVSDNGPEFPDGFVSGHGLQTVHDLLHLTYGENASISWKNSPKKEISIIINNLV